VSRVFVTGGGGVVGAALVERLVARGDEVIGLARSDASAAAISARGAQVVRGDVLDEDALARGMEACALAFHVAGVNEMCVDDTGYMRRVNVDGAVNAVRAAQRAGVPRLVHTSSAATIGEPPGTVGSEATPHRGWYLSVYEQTKTEGERAVFAVAHETGQDVVCVNPSSVQGPGRAGGTARFLLAFLDGRLKLFVQTNVSLVDIADCAEGHLLAAERGANGERYVLNGMNLTITEALEIGADVAGVKRSPRLVPRPLASASAAVVEGAFRVVRRSPPVCREMVRTLLHGHRYDGSRAERDLGLRYTDPRETVRRTVEWARSAGLLRNIPGGDDAVRQDR
jgi:dihydroflavonol-4-reductase